ncbi:MULTISPECIES: hypothetical protein [unclassified Saccharothrix]|uniref:hypothetical protein n=1 Tax=unclassified Saccharothrix TaxID=2593673 RepID=UPI00307FA6C7
MRQGVIVKSVVVLGGLVMLAAGVWGRVDPASFARFTNWPNHEHFLHDAGVFQIGIGLMMLSALVWRDVIAVVLAGFTVTTALHAANHALDLDLGGNKTDPWLLAALALVGLVGWVARVRHLKR